jgi:CheY-like chemotaxis protein
MTTNGGSGTYPDRENCLKKRGHTSVYVAYSGADALEIAKRVRPDIALLDIGMPDMSGYAWLNRSGTRPGARI